MDEVAALAREHRPKLIIAGWSAYPRQLDFAEFRRDRRRGRRLPAGRHGALRRPGRRRAAPVNPVPHAHVATTTTHKTLGGPRGGVILTNDAGDREEDQLRGVPRPAGRPAGARHRRQGRGLQDGRRPGRSPSGSSARSRGARILADRLLQPDVAAAGITVLTGGTDVHLVLVDLRDSELDGQQAEDRLHSDRHHRQPQRGAVRPAPADGHLRPADRHPRAGHPRLRRRRTSPRSPTSSPPP